MNATEVLIAARERVSRGWVQGMEAADRLGEPCFASSREAVCWCSSGAIQAIGDSLTGWEPHLFFYKAIGGGWSISRWNDTPGRTKEEVLAAFDRAIQLSRDASSSRELLETTQ